MIRMLVLGATLATALVAPAAISPALAATVKVTVNNAQITDEQISARVALLRAEQRGANNTDRARLATDELIDEQLKLQEAERLGIQISKAQIEDAYLTVARNLKLSAARLSELLVGSGVNPQSLKDRLHAGLAWQGVSQGAISARVSVADIDLEQRAREQLATASSFDYILKEVIFIIPQGSSVSSSRRTAEATQYRKSFQGCDSAVDLSLSYTDAAVIDVGRRHGTQLPEALAAELAQLNVGGISKPRVTERGVSMLAVCSKAEARDTAFIKGQIRQEVGTEKLQKEAEAYLARLRERASIFRM